jgi:hypothetical protein
MMYDVHKQLRMTKIICVKQLPLQIGKLVAIMFLHIWLHLCITQ